jgi:hypothetical protein
VKRKDYYPKESCFFLENSIRIEPLLIFFQILTFSDFLELFYEQIHQSIIRYVIFYVSIRLLQPETCHQTANFCFFQLENMAELMRQDLRQNYTRQECIRQDSDTPDLCIHSEPVFQTISNSRRYGQKPVSEPSHSNPNRLNIPSD